MQRCKTSQGKPHPLGATIKGNAVQFALFSRHAASVSLCLFEMPQDPEPLCEIPLDPRLNRTGDIWHILVKGIKTGTYYLYRVDGPYNPNSGYRYNRYKLLLDPYARAVTGNFDWNLADSRGYDPPTPEKDLSFSTTPDAAGMPKCIILDDCFDWQGLRWCSIWSLTILPRETKPAPPYVSGVWTMPSTICWTRQIHIFIKITQVALIHSIAITRLFVT